MVDTVVRVGSQMDAANRFDITWMRDVECLYFVTMPSLLRRQKRLLRITMWWWMIRQSVYIVFPLLCYVASVVLSLFSIHVDLIVLSLVSASRNDVCGRTLYTELLPLISAVCCTWWWCSKSFARRKRYAAIWADMMFCLDVKSAKEACFEGKGVLPVMRKT